MQWQIILFNTLLLTTITLSYIETIPTINGKDVLFFDHFNGEGNRWVISTVEKYAGLWSVRESVGDVQVVGDKGLVAESEARHHAIAVRFEEAVKNEGKSLFVQYEVRFENGLECGGAYIKLLTEKTMPGELNEFSNDTPYTIMFGPDRCGMSSKVHFIIRHTNPITGEIEEKHLKNAPSVVADHSTHLYSLRINPDNTFSITIDGGIPFEGHLLEDFQPSINPPTEIDDPTDEKPADWVDEQFIPDPNDRKPEDWDEEAPATIIDEEAVKPEGWEDNQPLYIPDPEQQKPSDWDDDLDGEFEASLIPNPKCIVGCGEWEKPRIPNPNYMGKWEPEMIENPEYIGEWHPRQIPNPNYFEDKTPYLVDTIGGLGIEIWTMQGGIFFDNVVIGYDSQFIDELYTLWVKKSDEEKRLIALNNPTENYLEFVNDLVEAGILYAKDEKNFWVVVGSSVAGLIIPLLLWACRPQKKTNVAPKKEGEKSIVYEESSSDESDE